MDHGFLSQYFDGLAAKKLSSVETDVTVSHQHEFNGVRLLKSLFGDQKKHIRATFIYLNDSDEATITEGNMTWYDAREKHPYRTEWRLYYQTNDASVKMANGDSLYICLRKDGSSLVVIAQKNSSIENQLNWLFGVTNTSDNTFQIKEKKLLDRQELFFASRLILDEIGVEILFDGDLFLEKLLSRFGPRFPTTREFSDFAREISSNEVDSDPDQALTNWLDMEEMLFRSLEKHLISQRLQDGFVINHEVDVDGFIQFSLSVQNRRKSRVGHSLENHIEALLVANGLRYVRSPLTENKSRPDFIFPDIESYRDLAFPSDKLVMLGAKSTCKDRWRQVLDEADRIERKHLLTLEAAISENQTSAMQERKIQLVVPRSIHDSYTSRQQKWLFSVSDFLSEVRRHQNHSVS